MKGLAQGGVNSGFDTIVHWVFLQQGHSTSISRIFASFMGFVFADQRSTNETAGALTWLPDKTVSFGGNLSGNLELGNRANW